MTRVKKIVAFSMMFILSVSAYALAGPVPDTGQTQSYTDTFGEDSDYTINPPSYTKQGTQMVRDNVTGLIWEVKDNDPNSINYRSKNYNWYDAQNLFITQLNASNFGGYSDWRLPSVKELSSIVNSGRYRPAINTDYFPNTLSSNYWSSTTDANDPDFAWRVDFFGGSVARLSKSYPYLARAVRGGL